ncbi:ImmA/IrrE family metallo-endopeptidase [Sporosarcina sp. FSL K6-1522]|uniref:ImmA/IrrE family metallo-endopeptidase n=1 Tax=Sporosarcina sp. FSL K6-1522 TaxID=2921554 RepID=UPI00315A461A
MQQIQTYTDYWEERAEKVLSHFHYTFPDEISITDICWRYGIRILPLDHPFMDGYIENLDNDLKAVSFPGTIDRRGTIFIKENLNFIEKKLLLAEEFCHIYAHQKSQVFVDKHQIGKLENQAKRMAAYLLMPAQFINTVYDAAYDEAVMISDIADHFLVTEEFTQYRLELIFNRKVDALITHKGTLGTIEWFE